MSELNVYHHELRPNEYEEFYLKYEADKVIAEKDKKIDLYKRGFKEDDKIIAYLYAELRHSKYKRCLDKAKWCERKRIDAADYRIPRKKWEFYDKWHKRWLKIAEKFKTNSTTQQGKG